MNIIEQFNVEEMVKIEVQCKLFEFFLGDIVCVLVKVIEGNCIWIQVYEGVCIVCVGGGINESFIVCKIFYGEGVECVFLIYFLMLEGVEVVCCGKVCCVKFYYLCDCCGKFVCIIENINVCFKCLNEQVCVEVVVVKVVKVEVKKVEVVVVESVVE